MQGFLPFDPVEISRSRIVQCLNQTTSAKDPHHEVVPFVRGLRCFKVGNYSLWWSISIVHGLYKQTIRLKNNQLQIHKSQVFKLFDLCTMSSNILHIKQ